MSSEEKDEKKMTETKNKDAAVEAAEPRVFRAGKRRLTRGEDTRTVYTTMRSGMGSGRSNNGQRHSNRKNSGGSQQRNGIAGGKARKSSSDASRKNGTTGGKRSTIVRSPKSKNNLNRTRSNKR